MPITRFHTFTVAFADATPDTPDIADARRSGGSNDRRYLIEEPTPGVWKAFEDGQLIAMAPEQHDELRALLEALRPLPDPSAEPRPPGEDGTWNTVVVCSARTRQGYRWWGNAPLSWARLDAVVERVQRLAAIPRQAQAQRNRAIAQQFFDRLSARDVSGAMECCGAQIVYSSPFFEGSFERQGRESVGAMWRAWLRSMPDARIVCDDIRASHEHASAYWTVDYTLPNSFGRVQQRISADLSFAEGKIIRHRDRFNLHEWASREYGTPGSLLGGKRAFQKWAVARERARLAAFDLADAQN